MLHIPEIGGLPRNEEDQPNHRDPGREGQRQVQPLRKPVREELESAGEPKNRPEPDRHGREWEL